MSYDAPLDPLDEPCDACGAEPAEPCRPGCIGLAQFQDEQEVLARTTEGGVRLRAADLYKAGEV